MSKIWRTWAILLLGIVAAEGHAQPPSEPIPETMSPPRGEERQAKNGPGPAKLDKLENSLPKENTLLLDGDAGNAFCDPGYAREEEPFHIWMKGEVLYWMFSPQSVATPLVTTVRPQTAINLANNFGAISQPNTVVLFGNDSFEFGTISGGRLTIGAVPGDVFPVELSGFWLNNTSDLFSAQTSGIQGSELYARPVLQTNVTNAQNIPQEGVFLVGGPDQSNSAPGFGGAIDIKASTNMWGIEANGYLPIGASDVLFIDMTFGYRHTELNETLEITNYLSSVNPAFVVPFNGDPLGFPPGATTIAYDNFSTLNQFNGVQVGARSVLGLRRLGLIFDAKLALGANTQSLNIYGNSSLVLPNSALRGITTVDGGVLALPSNSGETNTTTFAIIPEVSAQAVLKLTHNMRLFATASAMYWSPVVRPGNHVDSIVDTRQAPTSFLFTPGVVGDAPLRRFVETDFFAYGISFGVWIGF